MDIFFGPGTYMGSPYLADEAAKGIVAEFRLRDGDTVSKDQIIEYLAKAGVGPLWAPDVAMVLRNMFGVTPIFYESVGVGTRNLIEDLNSINDRTETIECTDNDLDMAISVSFSDLAQESKSDLDDAIIAALSLESLDTIAEISIMAECLSEQERLELEAVYDAGGESLVESWYEMSVRPHLMRFMDASALTALSEAIGIDIDTLNERVRSNVKQARNVMRFGDQGKHDPDTRNHSFLRNTRADAKLDPRGRDPLQMRAARARSSGADMGTRYSQGKVDAGEVARKASHDWPDVPVGHDAVDSGQKRYARKYADSFMNKTQNGSHMNFPDDDQRMNQARGNKPSPELRSKLAKGFDGNDAHTMGQARINRPSPELRDKMGAGFAQRKQTPDYTRDPVPDIRPHPVKHALNALGRIGSAVKGALGMHRNNQASAHPGAPGSPGSSPEEQPGSTLGRVGAHAKSFLSKLSAGVTRHGSSFGDAMKAKLRVRHPGLAYALHGAPESGEQTAAQHMGLHHHYKQMGYQLPGYDKEVHSPPANPETTKPVKVKQPRAPRVSRNPAFSGGAA